MAIRRGNIAFGSDLGVRKGGAMKQWLPLYVIGEYLIAMIQVGWIFVLLGGLATVFISVVRYQQNPLLTLAPFAAWVTAIAAPPAIVFVFGLILKSLFY